MRAISFPSRRRAQHGAAAVEFALVILLMLALMLGVLGYGALFWAQQKLSKAAGEGAQALLQANLRGAAASGVAGCEAARQEAGWLAIECVSETLDCAWTASDGGPAACAQVRVRYELAGWPLLATLRGAAGAVPGARAWFPDVLSAQAIVQIAQEPTT
ncbi:TadE/TadG family type IV pilus assembly protein [Bordetella pertussis]|uniref:TadE/TadG family type IV pilus assembly protein n=1 Tax=Bordetella pertussis TaxID=520 RepID=UPI0005E8294F|nr:TadE/TadG family type IV pilus assembly protein [Bordetella pertussis]UMA30998.1 pilus assembly protein [Bordetella pertussis]UMA34438.1 pilus assembly protein [Bordetella pertussis]CFN47943.1 Flp pilus assembly protein [Bordetella pertussis]CPL40196.1 Flp pilus assembly protein [Bordetella pertussis]CPQ72290.1 Flp pilus assembly protein [Bordetella pertussis]